VYRRCALAALALLLGAACSRGADGSDNADIEATLGISPSPPAVGPAQLTLRLTGPDSSPISGAVLEIEGNMIHAGMQPVFVEVVEDEPGRYLSRGFEFTMGGDWAITISGELADGSEFRRTFDVRGVRS
jgi:hypothetical protein